MDLTTRAPAARLDLGPTAPPGPAPNKDAGPAPADETPTTGVTVTPVIPVEIMWRTVK